MDSDDPIDSTSIRLKKARLSMLLYLLLPIGLLYIFGFQAKQTAEYACALSILDRHPAVMRETGRPIRPALFAWTLYFESVGTMRQGAFSTSISGPKAKSGVRIEFYEAPVGSWLSIKLKTSAGEETIYDGTYPCR